MCIPSRDIIVRRVRRARGEAWGGRRGGGGRRSGAGAVEDLCEM